MRTSTKILVCLYMAVVVLPLVVMALHLRDRAIFGALPPAHKPKLSLGQFRSEDYQKGYTAWFESRLGWKGNSIATDNAILYHLFRDTKPGSAVAIGRGGVLFKDEDIAYYNKDGDPLPSPARLDALAVRIAALQALLRAQNRALVPLLIPSKTSLYRDAVKPEWTRDLGQPRPSDQAVYRAMIAALDAHKVRYVDARALLTAPDAPREMVWGRFARHWTTYGACLAMQQVVQAYTSLTGKVVGTYDCKLARAWRPVSHDDFDLWNLLNTWRPPRIKQEVPVVEHEPPAEGMPKPSVMFVGTSFCWNIMRDAAASQRFSAVHMDYYHNTLVAWPENVHTPVQRGGKDWGVFLGKDLYVLDLFEVFLQPANTYIDEFLDQVGADLKRTADPVVPAIESTSGATISSINDLGVFEQQHYFELWGAFPNPGARYVATLTCNGVRQNAAVYYQNPNGQQLNVHVRVDPGTCDRSQQPPRLSGVSCTFHVQQGDTIGSQVFGPRRVCPGPQGSSGQDPDGRCVTGLPGC